MRLCLTATAIALGLAGPAAAQSTAEGIYTVAGTNFDGSAYAGTAEIRMLSKTTCGIIWTTGGQTSKGICMRSGNAFAASYALGDAMGLVVYEVQPDGTMQGVWTIAGQNGSGREVLTPR